MPQKQYSIIYADPPWSYNDKMSGHSFSLDHEYETQNKDWIENLPVRTLAADDCVLFMWAVSPLLPVAFNVIERWGFKYKTVAFVWNKRTSNGNDVANLGRWTMGNIELVLLATKGRPQRIRKDIKQLVSDERTHHSAKPPIVRELIVGGNLPRIELFARPDSKVDLWGKNTFDGWDMWGNEVESDITL